MDFGCLLLLLSSASALRGEAAPRVALNDGSSMASINLGGFIHPERTYGAVRSALSAGYHLVDTAQAYENEAEVGAALRDHLAASGAERSAFAISTKLSAECHGFEAAQAAVRASRDRLGVGYIDRVLIHTPYGGKLVETYDALLALQRDGVVRAVGVSNFGEDHLDALEVRPIDNVPFQDCLPLNKKGNRRVRSGG